MALEQPRYRVLERARPFEIREYEPYIIAEVTVAGSFLDAGNEAFGRLGGYIFGANKGRSGISMTAPVAQQKAGQSKKISMTSPVVQQKQDDSWRVSFMMPSEYGLETLPVPLDPSIRFSKVPARTMAVIVFSGGWSDRNFRRRTDQLMRYIADRGHKLAGEPVVARYNPPFVPPFFRKNEIQIEVRKP